MPTQDFALSTSRPREFAGLPLRQPSQEIRRSGEPEPTMAEDDSCDHPDDHIAFWAIMNNPAVDVSDCNKERPAEDKEDSFVGDLVSPLQLKLLFM